jgi:hypothetical protein
LEIAAIVTPRKWSQLTAFAAQAVVVDGKNQSTSKTISLTTKDISLTE